MRHRPTLSQPLLRQQLGNPRRPTPSKATMERAPRSQRPRLTGRAGKPTNLGDRPLTFKDIITLITSITLILGLVIFGQYRATERAITAQQEQFQQVNIKAQRWMTDTTTRLDTIQAGVERMAGEVTDVALRVDKLEGELRP